MLNFLPGKKTFLTGLFMVAVGIAQVAGIDVPGFEGDGGEMITEGLALIFLRLGIGKFGTVQ